MKFLVSIPAKLSSDGKWTTEREPVVPCFPSQHNMAFITVPGFRLAERAEVADIDTDPDEIAAALIKEYPSLPRKLHENYVLAIFKAVFDMPVGKVLGVAVSQKQAYLVDKSGGGTIPLWDEQPLV